MPTAGVDCAVQAYTNIWPGSTGGCVIPGTPSMELGVTSPWKWMDVDSGRLLWRTTFTLSPGLTLIVGPGTVPLYVHASTNVPGDTSHLTISVVRSNCLVPSGRTV